MTKVHFRSYIHKQMILFPQRIDKDIAEDDLQAVFSQLYMLHKSSHRLFEAQQTILFEISSIAAVNNELCGTQSKGRIKKRMYQF